MMTIDEDLANDARNKSNLSKPLLSEEDCNNNHIADYIAAPSNNSREGIENANGSIDQDDDANLARSTTHNQQDEHANNNNIEQQRNDNDSNNDDNDINMSSSSNTPPLTTRVVSWFLVGTVGIATLPMLLFGYHTGVMNAPEAVIFPGHSTASWSAAVSAFSLGGMLGAPPAGQVADTVGRRVCIIGILGMNVVAGLLHVMTPNMIGLIFARLLVGMAGGAATVLTPLYLSEISPPSLRGTIGTLTQLSCVVGILLSAVWEIPFDSTRYWRWIFVPIPVMAAAGLIFLAPVFLVESPPWLLWKYNAERRQEALHNLKRLRGRAHHDDESIIEMIMHHEGEQGQQRRQQQGRNTAAMAASDNGTPPETGHRVFSAYHSFGHYVRDPSNRIPLLSALLFPIAQQLSGINAVFYYSTQIFKRVGMQNPQRATLLAFGVNVVSTVGAMALMDRAGRKALLASSAAGMLACCAVLTLALQGTLSGMWAVLGVLLFISFFELGLGCIPFFLASEMIHAEYAGTVQSMAMSCNWMANFGVGLGFPYLDASLGAWAFTPFAVVLLFVTFYAVFILPESRGLTPAQVRLALQQRRGPRTSHHPIPNVDEDEDEDDNAAATAIEQDGIMMDRGDAVTTSTQDEEFTPASTEIV